jgi:hypothetical protein
MITPYDLERADTYALRAAVIAILKAMPGTCQELRIAAAKDPNLKPIGEAFPPLKDAEVRAALNRLLDAASTD